MHDYRQYMGQLICGSGRRFCRKGVAVGAGGWETKKLKGHLGTQLIGIMLCVSVLKDVCIL